MKVFVEIDALCKDISLEEILAYIRYGENSPLKAIPYNHQTLSIIHDLYGSEELIILCPQKMVKYGKAIIKDLHEAFRWNIHFKSYENFEEKIEAIEENSAFITSNALQQEIYAKTKENSFCGSLVGSLFFSIIAPNRKENRDDFFKGILLMPFEYLQILIPLVCCWPALISNSESIDKSRIILSIIGTIFSCTAAAFSREILEIPNEREHYMKGLKPLCSNKFLKDYSIRAGLIYTFSCVGFLMYTTYLDPLCGIISSINGFLFFCTYLLPSIIRIAIMTLTIILTTLITQTSFLKYLLGKL